MLATFGGVENDFHGVILLINITFDGVLSLPCLPHQHKDFLPECAGLYFVVAHTPEPQLLYLGKARNISLRWKNHHREPEINLLRKLTIAVDLHWLELRISDDLLAEWENKLIKELSPALNDTLTMSIEINRLENKVATLEEFALVPLPDLSKIPISSMARLHESHTLKSVSSCPRCDSQRTRTQGYRKGKPRYRCKDCGKTWS